MTAEESKCGAASAKDDHTLKVRTHSILAGGGQETALKNGILDDLGPLGGL